MIKDLREDDKKNCMDMFMPPGVIRSKETNIKQKSNVSRFIRQAIPQHDIIIRDPVDSRHNALGDNAASLAKQTGMYPTEKSKAQKDPPARDIYGKKAAEVNPFQGIIDKYQVTTHTQKANDINFEDMFKDHLPPEAVDLADFVKDLSNKNVSKGAKDIEKWNNEGRIRLKWAENLLP